MNRTRYTTGLDFPIHMDKIDPLKSFRHLFHIPTNSDGTEIIYFCGNSLGLQPKSCSSEVDKVMSAWSRHGVESWFEGDNPWISSHDTLKKSMAKIVGCHASELAIANTLSVNLHLLLLSFYNPTTDRYKIIIEDNAFPSDQYIVNSQAIHNNLKPEQTIVRLKGDKPNQPITIENIEACLKIHGHETSVILLGGINYVTGQALQLNQISQLGHKYGCIVGFDLAHAAGNIPLTLHADEVDFAAWCNYKYLNSGPGSVGSFYIHEKHHLKNMSRLEGWWGNHINSRFKMNDTFDAAIGAEAWVMSTPSQLNFAALKASMDIFDKTNMKTLREKSITLTGYLEFLINDMQTSDIEIITPVIPNHRGCQLSLRVKNGKHIFEQLIKNHVICDWREPDIIRLSPTPLYNRYEEVYRLVQLLHKLLK